RPPCPLRFPSAPLFRSLGAAAQRAFAHHFQRAPALTDSAHRVVHTTTAEAGLGHGETAAFVAEHMIERYAHIVVVQIALGAFVQDRKSTRLNSSHVKIS